MIAKKAREIANTNNLALEDVLNLIEHEARMGQVSTTFDDNLLQQHPHIYSQLKALGYILMDREQEHGSATTISW